MYLTHLKINPYKLAICNFILAYTLCLHSIIDNVFESLRIEISYKIAGLFKNCLDRSKWYSGRFRLKGLDYAQR